MSRATVRARVEAATPGPWWLEEGHEDDSTAILLTPCIHDGKHEEYGDPIAELWDRPERPFIAAARQDIPLLLAVADAAARVLEYGGASGRMYGAYRLDADALRDALAALEAAP